MMFKETQLRAREVGQALKADYLLEGCVRREGDRVRITARLVEAAAETHLWAETYERHLTDCLAVQADVAARIAQVAGGRTRAV
jgi:TolB-like protein